MRITGQDNARLLDNVTVYLTKPEAEELRDSLNALLEGPEDRHEHISDYTEGIELTVCLYDGHIQEPSPKGALDDK